MDTERTRLLYVYADRIPRELRQLVLTQIPEDEFELDTMTYKTPETDMCKKLEWAEVVLFAPGRHLDDAVLRHASDVKLMQLWSSGYDKFNIKGATKYAIPVANNGGANAIAVAEHTILLMLAVSKLLPDSHSRTVHGHWAGNSHGMDMMLLHQKTLGLIGFGRIGSSVAARASAFGMRILYADPRRAEPGLESRLQATKCDLEALLGESDVVSMHLHLRESTRSLIGYRELSLMKSSAILINTSRAQLVDEKALLRALEGGSIWGAGLDVYYQEPTRPRDPLLCHPHVVATPHMAGSTRETYVHAVTNAVENFRRVKAGIPPRWVVNG